MGSIFSRIKTWSSAEDVTAADLNAEFDNILNNLVPLQFDDYSVNAAQMQTTTDPGEVGTEILPTTLAGEIERLRFLILEITGKTEWYETPDTTLAELNAVSSSTGNRIVSGLTRADSGQLVALDPDGSVGSIVLRGAGTAFIYKIEGTTYTIDTDVTLSSLQAAPSTNHVALVDDLSLGGEESTKVVGENGTTLTVDSMGSEITALIGTRAAFRIVGSATEYFTAYIESATELTKIRRGYFFDTSQAPIERATISNNDVITLFKLTWIYANTAGAIVASYIAPIVDSDEPTATLGQYWFDLANDKWKIGNGASFDDASVLLIGHCLQHNTAATVGARTFDSYQNHNPVQSVDVEYVSATVIRSKEFEATVGVFGSLVQIRDSEILWDMAADLESGISEGASTTYYAYLDEAGNAVLSDIAPYDRLGDLLGFYHPYHTWRCVGSIANNGSSDFDTATLIQYETLTDDDFADATISASKLITPYAIPRVKTFTSNDTTTIQSDVNYISIKASAGGGGGGGGGDLNSTAGGGGGGAGSSGSFIKDLIMKVTAGDTITAVVGPAGTGGAKQTNGVPGGNTTISNGTWTITLLGGDQGNAGTDGSGGTPGTGGTGGSIVPSIGSFLATGGRGADGDAGAGGVNGATSIAYAGGSKGASNGATGDGGGGGGSGAGLFGPGKPGGNGGINAGAVNPTNGTAGAANEGAGGGGGGGARAGNTSGAAGGNGGSGVVIIATVSSTDFA